MVKSVGVKFERVLSPGRQPARAKVRATAPHMPKKQGFMLIRRARRHYLTSISSCVRVDAARRPTGMKIIKLAGLAVSIAAISFTTVVLSGNRSLASDANHIESPKPAPGWELQDLDGKTVHASDFKGKVVVLDFWATWCPPCRAEIPGFVELQKKYQAQGVAVIGVSVDQASADTVKAFAEKLGINYPVVLTDAKIEAAYGGVDGLPTTFVIDRSGRIVKQYLGFTEKSEIESEIQPLLKR